MKQDYSAPKFEDWTPGQKPGAKPAKVPGTNADVFTPISFYDKPKSGLSLDKMDISKFSSTQFVAEGTLLTNVEEYSKRIRKEAERQAGQIRLQAELARSVAEEEVAKADKLLHETEKECERLYAETNTAADEIKRRATEEGFSEGFKAGLEQSVVDNRLLTSHVLDLLAELKDLRQSLMRQHESEIVRQALLMAKKVVHGELTTKPEFILSELKGAIARFEGEGKIRISLNPIEYDFIAKHQRELEGYLEPGQPLVLKKDNNIACSEPLIESDFSLVELDLNRQFKLIEIALAECGEDRRSLFDPRFRVERESEKAAVAGQIAAGQLAEEEAHQALLQKAVADRMAFEDASSKKAQEASADSEDANPEDSPNEET